MPDGSAPSPSSPPLQVSSGTTGEAPQGDALRDVIAKLNQVVSQGQLALADPALAKTVGKLVEQGNDPARLEQGSFRTGVAYAVQDLEKLPAITVAMPAALRAEMTELAATSPGLQNERMQALVAKTPELTERGLIEDIRRAAYQTARSGPEQDTPGAAHQDRGPGDTGRHHASSSFGHQRRAATSSRSGQGRFCRT